MLHDVFALDPDQLFIPPGMQQPAGSGAGSLHHSAFDSGSMGEGDPGAELEAGFENEDPTKRTARLARNRESAQLSRQRKKQQLSELERRCRALQSTNSQMHHMVARLSHENHALRHHIAATGGAPLPPHLQMPATPPPLVVLPPGAAMPPGMVPVHPSMMPQTQKVPLPAAAAAAASWPSRFRSHPDPSRGTFWTTRHPSRRLPSSRRHRPRPRPPPGEGRGERARAGASRRSPPARSRSSPWCASPA